MCTRSMITVFPLESAASKERRNSDKASVKNPAL